jgi:hypothetical protein
VSDFRIPGRHDVAPLGLDGPLEFARLERFRADHPGILVGGGGFGTWQALIPEPDGETVVVRYTLRELLDRLDELTTGR